MSYLSPWQRDADNPHNPEPAERRDELRRDFLTAWATWDHLSDRLAGRETRVGALSLEEQARQLDRAAGAYGAVLGMRTTPFRDVLASLRRAGYGRQDALRALELAVAELGAP